VVILKTVGGYPWHQGDQRRIHCQIGGAGPWPAEAGSWGTSAFEFSYSIGPLTVRSSPSSSSTSALLNIATANLLLN
jgi:hypothetical protein